MPKNNARKEKLKKLQNSYAKHRALAEKFYQDGEFRQAKENYKMAITSLEATLEIFKRNEKFGNSELSDALHRLLSKSLHELILCNKKINLLHFLKIDRDEANKINQEISLCQEKIIKTLENICKKTENENRILDSYGKKNRCSESLARIINQGKASTSLSSPSNESLSENPLKKLKWHFYRQKIANATEVPSGHVDNAIKCYEEATSDLRGRIRIAREKSKHKRRAEEKYELAKLYYSLASCLHNLGKYYGEKKETSSLEAEGVFKEEMVCLAEIIKIDKTNPGAQEKNDKKNIFNKSYGKFAICLSELNLWQNKGSLLIQNQAQVKDEQQAVKTEPSTKTTEPLCTQKP